MYRTGAVKVSREGLRQRSVPDLCVSGLGQLRKIQGGKGMEVECVPCSEGEVSKPWRDLSVGRGVEVLERGAVRRHGCSYQSVKKKYKKIKNSLSAVFFICKRRDGGDPRKTGCAAVVSDGDDVGTCS